MMKNWSTLILLICWVSTVGAQVDSTMTETEYKWNPSYPKSPVQMIPGKWELKEAKGETLKDAPDDYKEIMSLFVKAQEWAFTSKDLRIMDSSGLRHELKYSYWPKEIGLITVLYGNALVSYEFNINHISDTSMELIFQDQYSTWSLVFGRESVN